MLRCSAKGRVIFRSMWHILILLLASGFGPEHRVRAQSRALLNSVEDIIEIRREMRRFNIDRDFYFDAVNRAIPSIVRSGLSETTGDVTLVIRFATMLNLAR